MVAHSRINRNVVCKRGMKLPKRNKRHSRLAFLPMAEKWLLFFYRHPRSLLWHSCRRCIFFPAYVHSRIVWLLSTKSATSCLQFRSALCPDESRVHKVGRQSHIMDLDTWQVKTDFCIAISQYEYYRRECSRNYVRPYCKLSNQNQAVVLVHQALALAIAH